MKEQKKIKVMFGENRIVGGTMFGKGVVELEPAKALACVQEGAVVSDSDRAFLRRMINEPEVEGAPLSIAETMERFKAFDYSDEVMRSMQFHQSEIAALNITKPLYGNKAAENQSVLDVQGGETSETGARSSLANITEGSETGGNASGAANSNAANAEGGAGAGAKSETGGGSTEGNQTGGEPTGGGSSETGGNTATGENGSTTGEGAKVTDDDSDIPEGFPSREFLIAGGVNTLEKLISMTKSDLLKIPQIGEATINNIGARLAAMSENK